MRRALVLLGAALCAAPLSAATGSLTFVSDVRISEPTPQPSTPPLPVMAVFEVKLSKADAFPVTVQWETHDLVATAPADYRAASGTLTFDGNETREIAVEIEPDQAWEGAETFLVTLSNPVGGSPIQIADGEAHGVITDQGSSRARCDFDGDGRSDVLV